MGRKEVRKSEGLWGERGRKSVSERQELRLGNVERRGEKLPRVII